MVTSSQTTPTHGPPGVAPANGAQAVSMLPPPFDQIGPEEADLVVSCMTPVVFQKDELIYEAGSESDALFIIDEGSARLQVQRTQLDTEGVVGFADPGTVLGEFTFFDRKPRKMSAYAESDVVKARRLDSKKLDQIVETHPKLAIKLLTVLGRDATQQVDALHKRLAEFLDDGVDPEVDELVANATAAQKEFVSWEESRVDSLLFEVASVVGKRARQFAKTTVVETKIGDIHDKTLKNQNASMLVLQSLMGKPGIGVVAVDEERGITDVAAPVGVVLGLIPITSPIATGIFKILICLKARNAIILSPHRRCRGVFSVFCDIVRDILEQNGAPRDLVQWVQNRASRKKTQALMAHPGIGLVLATGGKNMVEAAYRSGKPAFGVGPGNAPVVIAPDADVELAAKNVVLSKSHDNGLICGSENNVIVVRSRREQLISALIRAGAAVLTPEEMETFTALAIDHEHGGHFRNEMVGQSAELICATLGISRGYRPKLIVAPTSDTTGPYAREKMSPLVSLYTVDTVGQAFDLSKKLLEVDGTGHTAVIYTKDKELAGKYGREIPVSRVLVNTPASQGITGATTGLEVSMMLGCGTFGGNSTTDNITLRHVQNIKRVAHHDPRKDVMLEYCYHVSPGAALGMQLMGFDGHEVFAEGCVVRDSNGKEYLDFLAGVGVLSVGHRHPKVLAAVRKQLDTLPFSSRIMINEPQAKLGKRLAEITPGDLTYTFFCNSGTETVEGALKLARATTNRVKILSTINAFHGKSYGALAASGRDVFKQGFGPMLEGFQHLPYNDIDALKKAMGKDVAAVILEPVQGEGGVNVGTVEYMQAARQLCTEFGALLILDEVQTGLGRCGKMFACEISNITPDILCLAKALSGGVIPIGAIVATPQVWELFSENPFLHSSTFGGNPLACTAGLAAIEVIVEEDLPTRAAEMGEHMMGRLREVQRAFPSHINEVRGLGLLIGVEFTSEELGFEVITGLGRRGIIAAYTLNQPKVIRFEPPLVVTREQCNRAAEAFRESVAEAIGA